jgi:hypothetical protein
VELELPLEIAKPSDLGKGGGSVGEVDSSEVPTIGAPQLAATAGDGAE